MRLTTSIRQAFVASVLSDVPQIDYTTQIQDLAVKIALADLPEAVQALWANPKTREYVKTECARITSNRSGYVPGLHRWDWRDHLKATAKAMLPELDALDALAQKQNARNAVLEMKLKGVADACTTRKALLEAMPEFEKYLPAEIEKASQLPAITNLVGDLVKAGWPKQKAEERAKRKADLKAKTAA